MLLEAEKVEAEKKGNYREDFASKMQILNKKDKGTSK